MSRVLTDERRCQTSGRAGPRKTAGEKQTVAAEAESRSAMESRRVVQVGRLEGMAGGKRHSAERGHRLRGLHNEPGQTGRTAQVMSRLK